MEVFLGIRTRLGWVPEPSPLTPDLHENYRDEDDCPTKLVKELDESVVQNDVAHNDFRKLGALLGRPNVKPPGDDLMEMMQRACLDRNKKAR